MKCFKKGSILGEELADFNDDEAVVKVKMTRPGIESYLVIIPVTREILRRKDCVEFLAQAAYAHKHR
jgi:hypothetical protein